MPDRYRGDQHRAGERLRLQAALREREERFRALVQEASDVVVVVAADGRLTYCSPSFERLAGYEPAAAIGAHVARFVHPDDVAGVLECFSRIAEPGASTRAECRVTTGDGRTRHVETVFTNLLHEPAVRGFVLNCRDVTERTEAESRLRASEERYRLIVETAEEGIWTVDDAGRTTFLNERMADMLGYTPENATGMPLMAFVSESDRAGAEDWIASLPSGTGGRRDIRLQARNGKLVWTMAAARPTFHGDAYAGALIMVSDISERKEAETELRESQRQLNTAQRLSSAGSWDRNLATNATRWSKELFRILGVGPEVEPSYEAFVEAIHPDDRAAADELWRRVVQSGRQDGEFRIVRADGDVRILHAVVEATFDEAATPVRLTGTVRDVTERRRLEHELERQAFHDGLTGLPNRVLLSDRVDHALKRRQRTNEFLAVLFIDLDDFKTVNDSLGHNAGDELLVTLGRRLLSIVRPSDTVARLGGDEFAVLLEGAHQQTAERAAARILAEFDRPVLAHGRQVFVHACVGIAVADDQNTAEDLLRNADAAMYAAKNHGKNQFRVFQSSMHTAARRRLELESELQRAVDRNEFLVYYQPIVQLETGRISGLEALVRWAHPEMGIVPPAEFVPIAEESGLIVPIGTGVLREATAWLQQLDGAGNGAPLTMSVNLSPRQFAEPDLLDSIEEAVRDSALDPWRLVIEITEGVLVEDTDIVVPRLDELRRRGVRVAVDDFGTGYSSLSRLRRLPIDILKIDRMFVSGVTEAVEDAVVADAVVRVADALGLTTIAEGIETPEQARELQALGSTFGQGYLYSPPLASAEIQDVLQRVE